MALLIVEFISILLLILSLLLLTVVLLRHFKGMNAPAYWLYYLGAFSLLAISGVYTRLLEIQPTDLDSIVRFVAHLSIFIGSYEIYKRYESRILDKLKTRRKTAGKKRRKR